MRKVLTTLLLSISLLTSFGGKIMEYSKCTMPFGVYYYPEQWSSSQWERDLKHIADLGFEFTHFAEFAWSTIEPSEGDYNFDWLDSCVNLAGKYGLKVVMCTPSPTPPAWLTEKHPEILIVTESGHPIKHGMRLNCNGANPIYQEYIERVILKMAERYGNNPVVIGWQIDNEPHFEGLYDYSDFARISFRNWLQRKYGSIENLNKAWGGAFWSYAYNNFEQIELPNNENHSSNPNAFIDFKRYNADSLAEALAFQYDVLKKHVNSSQWITTNFAYCGFLPSVDPFRSRSKLDFASYTMYPMNTFLEYPAGQHGYRLGSGMELAFQTELTRSVSGKTGIMELQPGQINWGTWNSIPLPGAVRMWIWHCYALGDEFVCTYRFRQPLYGPEQFHKGIVEPDGISLSPGGKEFIQALEEINRLKNSKSTEPKNVSERRTAFLWKHDNLFSAEHTQVRGDWNIWKPYLGIYKKLKTLGAPVDIISEEAGFDSKRHPFMVMPAYEMVDSKLIVKLRNYVEEGGNLVLTYRSGIKDNNSHLWEAPLQQPIYELAGLKVEGFDQLPSSDKAYVDFEGKTYAWNIWGDMLSPSHETQVWAKYADQFYKDTPCVTFRKHKKGSVCYIGVMSEDFKLEEDVLRKFYRQAGADVLELPDYFFVEYRDGHFIAVNYTSENVNIPLSNKDKIVMGEKTVKPGHVTVWITKD